MFVRAAGGPVARCVRAAHTAATDTTVCATDTEHCDLFCVLTSVCSLHSACAAASTLRTAAVGSQPPRELRVIFSLYETEFFDGQKRLYR